MRRRLSPAAVFLAACLLTAGCVDNPDPIIFHRIFGKPFIATVLKSSTFNHVVWQYKGQDATCFTVGNDTSPDRYRWRVEKRLDTVNDLSVKLNPGGPRFGVGDGLGLPGLCLKPVNRGGVYRLIAETDDRKLTKTIVIHGPADPR